jgi:hypothetical protein
MSAEIAGRPQFTRRGEPSENNTHVAEVARLQIGEFLRIQLRISGFIMLQKHFNFAALAIVVFGAMLVNPGVAKETAKKSPEGPAKQAAVSPKDGVIRLFDGKTLGDCYTWLKDTKREDPRNVFTVEDGMIHVSGDGLGALVTNKKYRDYHLVLEYKFGERRWHKREQATRDSGVLIHSNGKDGGYQDTWMPSLECQIIEGGAGDFVPVPGVGEDGKLMPLTYTCNVSRDRDGEFVWDAKGEKKKFDRGGYKRVNWYGRDPDWTDTRDFRGKQDVDSPHGKWTRMDVISDGGHIQTFVNGKKVNEAFDVSPDEGRIQLQTELAEIFFRRWELWPLANGPKPAPAEQE